MKIFADTANLKELEEAISWGVVDGCTTNPKILSNEKGSNFEELMKKVLSMVKGPVSVEVTTNNPDQMVVEAEKFAKWSSNVVIKIPMCTEGLRVVGILSKKGIKTNVTACMSLNQAVLAAKAGATYVSLFYGRIGDSGYDPYLVLKETVDVFKARGFKSEIIAGSMRSVLDVNKCILAGAHVVTIPFAILKKMAQNTQTDATIAEFLKSWEEFKKAEKK
jgi:transaldolase